MHRPASRRLKLLLSGALGALALASTTLTAQASDDGATGASQVTVVNEKSSCDITLPGGYGATVTATADGQSARLDEPGSSKGGVFSLNDGGHQILLPARALADVRDHRVALERYDTAALANRSCGISLPKSTHATTVTRGGYRLGRLTVRTLDSTGAQADIGLVMLMNVDDQDLVTTDLTTFGGLAKIAVPVGHYAVVALTGSIVTSSYTFVINPEFTVRDNTTVTLDQRTATVQAAPPSTPKPAELVSSSINVGRTDGSGAPSWGSYWNLDPRPATFKFNPTGTVAHGRFVVTPEFELQSPISASTPYAYHIAEAYDHVPAAFPTRVDPTKLATVIRDYGADTTPSTVLSVNVPQTPWQASAPGQVMYEGFSWVPLGVRRAEYFSTGPEPTLWSTIIDGDSEINTPWHSFEAGTTTHQGFHLGPQHPGVLEDPQGVGTVCPACTSDGTLEFGIYPINDNNPGDVAVASFDDPANTASFELRRDGETLAEADQGPLGVMISAPTGSARYELSEHWTRNRSYAPLSTGSDTTWTFTADSSGTPGHLPTNWECLDGGSSCTALPLLYAYYQADGTLLNSLTPGPHTLTLSVEHQEHSVAPAVSGAAVSVSYDDGATWKTATTNGSRGNYHATFQVPSSDTNGFVAVRIAAWDKAGNRIDQTVRRAYSVTP